MPKLKEDFYRDVLMASFKRGRMEAAPAIGSIRSLAQREGTRHTYQTHEGAIKETEYAPVAVEIPITQESIIAEGVEGAIERFWRMGQEAGSQQERLLFETVTRVTEETGNVVDAGGQPMTLELFLATLDKIQIDFDPETEKPLLPNFYIHPDQANRVRELVTESLTNKEMKQRFDELIERKRKEWRDRENYRQLVD